MQYKKVCVGVIAFFPKRGGIRPVEVVWEDGRKFFVESVRAVGRSAPHIHSILPERYICTIGGRERNLYFEQEKRRWFVEVPQADI